MLNKILCIFLLGLIAAGCHQNDKPIETDTTTSGHIRIVVDESLKPLMESEIATFQSIYKNAKIDASYQTENASVNALLNNRASMAILTRKLNPEELYALDTQNIVPSQVKAALDGVALILNRNNPDTSFTYAQLKGLLNGNIQQWQQLNEQSELGKIVLVFDFQYSSILRWMLDSVSHNSELPSNCLATFNNQEVIDYVARTPRAIGIIGLSWINEQSDSLVNHFSDKIRVAGIASENRLVASQYYQPFQTFLAQRKYPLMRDVYLVNRQDHSGLGSGFSAFVCGDKGQQLVMKSGLLPLKVSDNVVHFTSDKN